MASITRKNEACEHDSQLVPLHPVTQHHPAQEDEKGRMHMNVDAQRIA
jgi:hypothetical protein